MTKKNKLSTILLIGLSIIIFQLVNFFTGDKIGAKVAIDYVALLFKLISDVVVIIGILYTVTSKSKSIFKVSLISSLSIYWVVTFILYLFLKGVLINNIGLFIIIEFIALFILLVIIMFLSKFSSKVSRESLEISWFDKCEDIIYKLLANPNCQTYKDDLNKILEAIKYSDKASTEYRKDNEIYERINKIYEMVDYFNDEKEIKNSLSQILLLIKERNTIVLKSKRGSF